MKVIVDRFEGSTAVVELPDRTMANLPSLFIPLAKEGDVISIEIDSGTTSARKDRIKKKADKLWAD